MKIEIHKDEDHVLEFTLKDATTAFANGIRRCCMGQVPTFAIQKVTIYENTSAMFDEYVTNRLGMIPLKSESKHTDKDEIMFTLDAEGPCTVTSKDLKSSDSKIKVANQNLPIMKLLDKQKLRLEATAILGKGRVHGKFQPGIASYKMDKSGAFKFKVESFGQLNAKHIVLQATRILEEKCEELEKLLKE
ncbi:DNA-directed RNA polymerase subunit D [Candidatus Gugararchaeum adminiculabundum]|nr:DNA-directed RNA polymerase subunit D [Candidatus Gugararchaeum adminiculabundum]